MADTRSSTFGIFSDRLSTESAVDALMAAGFRGSDISALFPDEIQSRTRTFSPDRRIKAVHCAAGGATAGMLIGGLLGALAPFVAVGPLAAGLLSLLTGGAAGALIGWLVGTRLPEYEERYESRVRRGDILVAVHCDNPNRAKKAREILKRTGGGDVSSNLEGTFDFIRLARRPPIRPAVERTVIPTLRLVPPRVPEQKAAASTGNTVQAIHEVRTKSAAS